MPFITPLVLLAAIAANPGLMEGSESETETESVVAIHAQQSLTETPAPADGNELKNGSMIVTVNLSVAAIIAGISAPFYR